MNYEKIKNILENGGEIGKDEIIEYFKEEENIENIEDIFDRLSEQTKLLKKLLKKEILLSLEKLGNECLHCSLDAASRIVGKPLTPEEREKEERKKEINFQKASIFFSAPFRLKK